VDSDIEVVITNQIEMNIEGVPDSNDKRGSIHEKTTVPKRGRPKKNKSESESAKIPTDEILARSSER